jgi:hypothetical protein
MQYGVSALGRTRKSRNALQFPCNTGDPREFVRLELDEIPDNP